MKIKDKIEELEKRIKELEARPQVVPVYWPIYVQPPIPYIPPSLPWFVPPIFPQAPTYPVYTPNPIWISGNPTTCQQPNNEIAYSGGSVCQ